ncbi:UdgX family uracil-DNA binding protein [Streptomyces sp. NBC_01619]|uniref:UdgX family uracil-DNA binding protein n=1 Tax=Streptomyces sp. NBC_01619 TaxID=2975901 RepID=UPI00224F9F22|nr:UdgX family uracil-DNA binding protein [Streptomyces sp. NBC_01619]MCX4513813.1 UdgX family uracil-DNA binding protein [Streptomyces sp. NBC_01619]
MGVRRLVAAGPCPGSSPATTGWAEAPRPGHRGRSGRGRVRGGCCPVGPGRRLAERTSPRRRERRRREMVTHTTSVKRSGQGYDATPFLPGRRAGLPGLRRAAAGCRGCPLYEDATQTVFGEGDTSARILLLGEQPGDQEDRQGRPFVGPAGKVLERAPADAGIHPDGTYVTNAVKHFKFTVPEGRKRRIHKSPSLREMTACRPWLVAELQRVRPELVVALGSTAGKALLGPSFRVTEQRGALLPWPGLDDGGGDGSGGGRVDDGVRGLVATIHPSAVLRADDRDAAYKGLVSDLRVAAHALDDGGGGSSS